MKFFAISGSLRRASLNSMLLRALARLAPPGIEIALYTGLGELPLFNPDLEAQEPPPVASLRRQLIAADALIIATPEYAHGVSGPMKNALDWMVGNDAFVYKPLALLNTSPRATHAQAALRETLCTMSAHIVEESSLVVSLLGSQLDEDGIVDHPELAATLIAALDALRTATLQHTAEHADR